MFGLEENNFLTWIWILIISWSIFLLSIVYIAHLLIVNGLGDDDDNDNYYDEN